MTNAEFLARIRQLINDPDKQISTDEELNMRLDEACSDFSRASRCVRKNKTVSYTASGKITLPIDCYEVVRFYDDAIKTDITPISSKNLDAYDLTKIGTLEYYYRDLTSDDKISLYPIPEAEGTITLYYIHGHQIGSGEASTIEIPSQYHDALACGAAAKILIASDFAVDLQKASRLMELYQAQLAVAIRDASKNFSSHPRTIPYRHF